MRGALTREQRLEISVTKLTSSNDRLRADVLALRQELKTKDRRIANLEAKLEDKEQQRKLLLSYLYKPGTPGDPNQPPKPRGKHPGAPAFHRPIPPASAVTEERTFSLTRCPMCRHAVGPAVDTVVKYEEDIDLAPRTIVKKYTITRHWCGHCETFVKAPEVPPIQRIGLNVLGYLLYARYRLRLPIDKIQESLCDLHDFRISAGEIVEQLKAAEQLFGKDYQAIVTLIQDARVVHADETGWRMDGANWWLWVFTTDQGTRYVIEDTRGKGVARRALGGKQDRVIISDGYAAYQNLPGDKQQCWVHLLRAAKLASIPLYEDLVALYQKLGDELAKPIAGRDPPWFSGQLEAIVARPYAETMAAPSPASAVAKVQARIQRHRIPLLTCLNHDGVLPENNPAERAIRPQVVMRKIFGGSRSVAGATAHAVNTSVIETLRQQNPDKSFFAIMLPLLKKRRSGL